MATGWDTVMMLAQAVEAAGSTDGAAVAKALEDGQFKLLTGRSRLSHRRGGPRAGQGGGAGRAGQGGKATFLGWRHAGKHAGALTSDACAGAPRAGAPSSPRLDSRVAEVSVEFAGLRALDRVSLALTQGEILGLIGPNGSGKTTLVNAITGQVPVRHGRITAGGVDLTGRPPREVALAGVARTFQVGRLFDRLTVRENVEAAALSHGAGMRRGEGEGAEALLEEFGLGPRHDELAGGLSFGDKRRVEMARALAGEPQFLLLDEPAAGMNDVETEAAPGAAAGAAAKLAGSGS